MSEPVQQADPQPARRQATRTGVVESVSGKKSIRVAMEGLRRHELYGKYMRRRTRLLVHDEQNQAQVGDVVDVTPCRPMSKRKSWRLLRVVRKVAKA